MNTQRLIEKSYDVPGGNNNEPLHPSMVVVIIYAGENGMVATLTEV